MFWENNTIKVAFANQRSNELNALKVEKINVPLMACPNMLGYGGILMVSNIPICSPILLLSSGVVLPTYHNHNVPCTPSPLTYN